MSDFDDRSASDDSSDDTTDRGPAPSAEDYDEATQSSQDRGHSADADVARGEPADRAGDTRTAEHEAGFGTFSSEHGIERDTQAGAGSLGETAQDGVGGFFTDPAEAAGLMPDPEGSDDSEDAGADPEGGPGRGAG